jgi:hypothetical protein
MADRLVSSEQTEKGQHMARRIPNSDLFDAIWSWAWDERLCPSGGGTISVLPIDLTTEDQEPDNGVVTPAANDDEEQSFGSQPAKSGRVKEPKVLRKKV